MIKHHSKDADFLVIGAGIAGLATAAELSEIGSVIILEGERSPAQHSSGRSAAVFIDWYGGEVIQPFTKYSRTWMEEMSGFAASKRLLTPRGLLLVAEHGDEDLLMIPGAHRTEILSPAEVRGLMPHMREERVSEALYDPAVADINVQNLIAFHQHRLRAQTVQIITSTRVTKIRRNKRSWAVDAGTDSFNADVIVNCAGAWADQISVKAGLAPIGLNPLRRTVCIYKDRVDSKSEWPLVYDARGRFYFKPYGDCVLASPDDETPSPPLDAQPDAQDVNRTTTIINEFTTLALNPPIEQWAGLRTFSSDRGLVVGTDPEDDSFVWCAGLGGVGFQTSPAVAMCVMSLIQTGDVPAQLSSEGVTTETLSPGRFRD